MTKRSKDDGVPIVPEGGPIDEGEPSSSAGLVDADEDESTQSVGCSADKDKVDRAPSELKANQLVSVEDLIRFAYQLNGKKLGIPSSVVRRIAAGAQLADDAAEPLFALVRELLQEDPMLTVPPRVLAFAASANPGLHLRRRLEQTMAIAIRHHAIFNHPNLREALDDPPKEFDSVLDRLRDAVDKMTPEQLGVEIETLKSSHRNKLYANAIVSLTLLLALRDGWTVDGVAGVLYSKLWRNSIDQTDRLAAIGAMADARDGTALAALGRVFERQLREAERLAKDAQSEADGAFLRAQSAEVELEGRDQKIDHLEKQYIDLTREVEGLRESLASAERGRVHDRSHHLDDYEALRTRIVRVLDKQIKLLSDGLHALREGVTEVTEEYAERAITEMSRELTQLRGQGGNE